MSDTKNTLPATDILVTPEGISWSVGNVLITFAVSGRMDACLTHDDLPEGATVQRRLTEYAANILTAAISARAASAHTMELRSAILQMQALHATHGSPESLEDLPANQILKNVEAILR